MVGHSKINLTSSQFAVLLFEICCMRGGVTEKITPLSSGCVELQWAAGLCVFNQLHNIGARENKLDNKINK